MSGGGTVDATSAYSAEAFGSDLKPVPMSPDNV